MRVNVQLINAQNDSHLWADKYDRKLTDIFAIESEIAGKIADTLQAKLSSAERRVTHARPTESNSEAHQLYLRGRYADGKTKHRADLQQRWPVIAIRRSRRTQTDAAAYAGLADCDGPLLTGMEAGTGRGNASKARAAASKALQIDGQSRGRARLTADGSRSAKRWICAKRNASLNARFQSNTELCLVRTLPVWI